MLVLSRKPNEQITMLLPSGEEIVLTVIEDFRAGKVRLGISAPRAVEIYRNELLPQVKPQLKVAA